MRITGGEKKGIVLKTRGGQKTRPLSARVKESMFEILRTRVINCAFYDFFAGNGAVGIEALSRGAARAEFIEKDFNCVKIIRKNISICDFRERASVKKGDVLRMIPSITTDHGKDCIVFLGAPYNSGLTEKSLENLEKYDPFPEHTIVIAEIRKNEQLREAYGLFRLFREKIYGDTKLRLYERRSY